jgi:ABC-type transporter lipoprotein component MlaA/pimeloyl-ACP methyl ester carboxylesterase
VKIRNLILFAICVLGLGVGSRAQGTNPTWTNSIVLPELIPDPLEPLNRGLWAVNEGAVKGLVKPSAKVYRAFVPPPFRLGFSNASVNVAFPKRILNNLLQQRWGGARDESLRFLCNSVLGFGGFLDVASEFKIPHSYADFGQTFGRWGWNQNFYLMIPLAGPTSDRDALGSAADSAVNPLTYYSPYSYIPTGLQYNNLTDSVDNYVRLADSEMDPYSLLRYIYAIARKERPIDWHFEGGQDAQTLETLQTALFTARDRHFPDRGHTAAVQIHSTGRELPYTLWLQNKPAPIVYVLPGIGAYRLNAGAAALAEVLFEKGFSVVTISSAFNYEFIGNALSADLPGYAASDVKDIHSALTLIDQQIQKEHPGKIRKRGLLGYSMGGFHTLLLAANASKDRSLLQFDRYVAIDAPVRLIHGIEKLDSLYNAALEWPAAERTDRIEQLFAKIATILRSNGAGSPTGDFGSAQRIDRKEAAQNVAAAGIPLSSIESRFLIGLVFRLNLRDVIFFTQMRHNQGVLKHPIDKWKREPVYREIMDYSFADYLNLFIGPYYKTRGIDLQNEDVAAPSVDLRAWQDFFKANASVRLIENEDDILLEPEDVRWLDQTFGDRVTLFAQGGHLGNLGETPIQAAIVSALSELQETAIRGDLISAVPKRIIAP